MIAPEQTEHLEHHRPKPWPQDERQDFRAHDDAASWWLFVLSVPLLVAAATIAMLWVF